MKRLIMFHGRECPHCTRMMPLVDKLQKETGIALEKLEVWHNEKNADLMRSYKPVIAPKCGGQLRDARPSSIRKPTIWSAARSSTRNSRSGRRK